jgi:hypothetical protein
VRCQLSEKPKDYGIMKKEKLGFAKCNFSFFTLRDLFRFLLVFRCPRTNALLSFFRFFFWKMFFAKRIGAGLTGLKENRA